MHTFLKGINARWTANCFNQELNLVIVLISYEDNITAWTPP